MKTIEETVKELYQLYVIPKSDRIPERFIEAIEKSNSIKKLEIDAFKSGVEFAQRWIPVDEEIEYNINIDGIMYSENVLLKIKKFEFPVVGCYMRANDDEFWEIYGSFEIEQSDITHYRPIELK